MKIYSIYDREFNDYGRVVDLDFSELLDKLSSTDCPSNGTIYVPSDSSLEGLAVSKTVEIDWFGGMPIQVGYCNGNNTTLNALEYHKNSEINVGDTDFILLLAKKQDMVGHTLDTATVKAFKVPKGVGVELYATSLHYAPLKVDGRFRVAVFLPQGTNTQKPENATCPLLFAKNKWLLAHKDSPEAQQNAYVGLIGDNITL